MHLKPFQVSRKRFINKLSNGNIMAVDIKLEKGYLTNTVLSNYTVGNKSNALREYLMTLGDKLNLKNYSNTELKNYIESNYDISFSKNKSKGKTYVNYNTFRKIAGEIRTRQKIVYEVKEALNNIKEKNRLNKLNDLEESLARTNYELVQEAFKEENEYLNNLEESIAKENLKEYEKESNYSNLINLVNASNVYTGRNNIVLRNASLKQLEIVLKNARISKIKEIQKELDLNINPEDISGQMSKLIILSNGEKIVTGNFDGNGIFRTEIKNYLSISEESVFENIIKNESENFRKMSRSYSPKTMVLALKENYALAVQGNNNVSFEDLVTKYSKLN
jgi:hypothetical protein